MHESGYEQAMYGLSLSRHAKLSSMHDVALKLVRSGKDGECKFLESICVWLEIYAPLYWWNQFDTYWVGVTKQSESTMYTLMRTPITSELFAGDIPSRTIESLEAMRTSGDFDALNTCLPRGFLQSRVVCTNYKVLRHIIEQRHDHMLLEWRDFCHRIVADVDYPEFLEVSNE